MKLSGFIFDDVCITPDRQIGCHTHPRWELSYVICGGGMRTVGDTTEPISEGEIIFIPPNIAHVWSFDKDKTDKGGNIRNISVFFQPELIEGMKTLFPELRKQLEAVTARSEAISYNGGTYDRIKNLLLSMRGLSATARLPLMMELIIAMSDASGARTVGRNGTLDRIEKRREEVRIYCACNYARDIKLDHLARHVGMNKSAFCTFMRRHMGMPLSHYVNGVRLQRAKEKLISFPDRSVSEIAMSCGFSNVTYFNKLFKARYGCSPKSVRQKLFWN